MNSKPMSSILLGILLVSTNSILADSGHHGKGRFMAFFDTNEDSVVTKEEFKEAAAERFKRMDADNSGTVSSEEFRNYVMEKREKRNEMKFQETDVNNDGKVSQAEYLDYQQKKAQSQFQYMDKDGDGMISESEFDAGYMRGKGYGGHGKGKIFSKLDKNSDGQITQEESLTAWTEWFTKIDSNGDNVVTAEEVREYRTKNFNRSN